MRELAREWERKRWGNRYFYGGGLGGKASIGRWRTRTHTETIYPYPTFKNGAYTRCHCLGNALAEVLRFAMAITYVSFCNIYTLFRLVLSHVEYFLGNGLNVLRSVENLINFPRFPFVASATTTCSLCTCRMFCELKSTDKLSERERERVIFYTEKEKWRNIRRTRWSLETSRWNCKAASTCNK